MPPNLTDFCQSLNAAKTHTWAWGNYKATVIHLIKTYQLKSVFEIGAGRAPLFTPAEAAALNITYYINDVSQPELDRAGPEYANKICADISLAAPNMKVDLIISHMVYEHIKDNARALCNQLVMLNPGGCVFHFHPVLYSIPFCVNAILNPKWSEWLLKQIGNRNTETYPKFPAHYSECHATAAQEKRIQSFGFAEARALPFYGHDYYRKFPILPRIHRMVTNLIAQQNWRALATFCYTMARK